MYSTSDCACHLTFFANQPQYHWTGNVPRKGFSIKAQYGNKRSPPTAIAVRRSAGRGSQEHCKSRRIPHRRCRVISVKLTEENVHIMPASMEKSTGMTRRNGASTKRMSACSKRDSGGGSAFAMRASVVLRAYWACLVVKGSRRTWLRPRAVETHPLSLRVERYALDVSPPPTPRLYTSKGLLVDTTTTRHSWRGGAAHSPTRPASFC